MEMSTAAANSDVLMVCDIEASLQIAKISSSPNLCNLHEDISRSVLHLANMAESKNGGPNYLRAWREFREMTQEELGAAIKPPTTGSVISLLEEGDRGLSLKWLRRLAPALRTRPGFIADMDPADLDTRALEMIDSVPEDQKERVLKIIETFVKDGTNG